MLQPLIIDLFAGGGGASMGIEMALGRSPDVAINHDPVAVAMHAVNHPAAAHHCQDVWAVKPETVLPGLDVGLIWASPDCKHFSKAKGGKPKERAIRDLAWVVVDWIEKRRPGVACIENVEEFQTWGPLDNEGNPIAEFAGQTFEDWVGRIRRAGYHVEWRESRACDYGAPTIRKRLIIIAKRKDLGRIVWPKPTHGAPDSDGVKRGRLKPWRTAAEIIDWSLPCPSIFDDAATIMVKHGLRAVRPLAANTGARVARGVKRYVLDAAKPFLVSIAHGDSGGRREYPIHEPYHTVTVSASQHAVIAPHLMTMRNAGKPYQGADEPTHTVTAGGAHMMAVAGTLVQAGYGEREGQAPRALDPSQPLGTVVGTGKHAAVAVCLAQHNGGPNMEGAAGRAADAPLSTLTVSGSQQGLIAAHLIRHFGTSTGAEADAPAPTVMPKGQGKTGLVAGALVKYYGPAAGQPLDAEPLHTVTTKDRFGLVEAALCSSDAAAALRCAALDAPPFGPEHELRAREVAAFLRAHGAWDEREFVTLDIGGATFVLADIGMRMLAPRELFNAQGFPAGYVIDRDATGRVFSKSDQIGRAGNSVSPPWAAAHVAANAGHLAAWTEAAQ